MTIKTGLLPCVYCGGAKDRGQDKAMCASCRERQAVRTPEKIAACTRCGGEKDRGRGKALCSTCREASSWSGVVRAPRPTTGCTNCGSKKQRGNNLCAECKKSAQKVNRTLKPCSNCGEPKDRSGLGVKLCLSCKNTQAHRAMLNTLSYRQGSQWSEAMNRASSKRRENLKGTLVLENRTRNSQLKAWYGIDLAEYERRLSEQGGVCAICKKVETKLDRRSSTKAQRLSVDHDHNTGVVRGLLCSRCNTAIGIFGEDTDRMLEAIMYLKRARPGSVNHLEATRA